MDHLLAASLPPNPHMVFNGEPNSYQAWRVRTVTEVELLWDVPLALVAIPAQETEAEKQERLKQDKKAAGLILSRLGNAVIRLIAGRKSLRSIISALDENFGHVGSTAALNIRSELESLRLNPKSDPQKFFARVDGLFAALAECGKPLDDQEKFIYYTRMLPESMTPLRQTGEAMMPITSYTSTVFKGSIIREVYAQQRFQTRTDEKEANGHQNLLRNVRNNGNGKGGNQFRNGKPVGTSNGESLKLPVTTSLSPISNSFAQQNTHRPVQRKFGYKGKNFDLSKVMCFKCNEKGHYANNCSKAAQANFIHVEDDKIPTINMIESEPRESSKVIAATEPSMRFQGDSGANRNIITENSEFLTNVRELTGAETIVKIVGNNTIAAEKAGDLAVSCEIDGQMVDSVLRDVLYVPSAGRNFLATTLHMTNGGSTHAENGQYSIFDAEKRKILQGVVEADKIWFNLQIRVEDAITELMSIEGTQWHIRFGHMCAQLTEKLCVRAIGGPTKMRVNDTVTTCQICSEAKMKKNKHSSVRNRASRILELIHIDIMGRISPASEDDHLYVLVIVDDWSHFVVVHNLKTKDEAAEHIKSYVRRVNNMSVHKVANIRSDNALEFINADLRQFFNQLGINLDLVPPHTPELNSIVERMNGTLGNRIRALLYQAKCPLEWWHFAAEAAAYLINRSPTSAIDFDTPYFRWTGRKPDISYIRVFGSVVRVLVPETKKLDKRAWTGVLVGYGNMGCKIYNVKTRKVVVSRNIKVDESKNIANVAPQLREKRDRKLKIEPKIIRTNIGEIAIRAIDAESSELTYDQAIVGPNAKEWRDAINYELQMMRDRDVWCVIPKPSGKIMDTKWVLKCKKESNGLRFRARLCARGYMDQTLYDITQTYSPTVTLPIVRLFVLISFQQSWFISHLDVSSAFLYGDVTNDVVIQIPKGYDADSTKYALKLNRALYGLKIASNTWYRKVREILQFEDYLPMVTERSVYVRKESPTRCTILVFVDDMLITGADADECHRMIRYLESKIQIKNLEEPRKFLGIQFTRERDVLKLSQEDYIETSAQKFQVGQERAKTPMEKDLRVPKPTTYDQEIPLRELLGTLMYASIGTRPDIAYASNYLCRFQSRPTGQLMNYARRVLSYSLRTKSRSLNFRKADQKENVLTVICDAAFATDEDRKSTTGIVIKYNGNTFHWRTTKQKSITKSSTEAEYLALSTGDSEARSFSNFLHELGIDHEVELKSDSLAAINIIKKRDTHNCRHIEIAHRVIEESLETGRISRLVHVMGEDNEADLLTKSTSYARHEKLVNLILN